MPLVALLLACHGPDAASPDLRLTDATNYAFASQLAIPSHRVAAHTDVRIDWQAATTDLACHALDPAADVDLVTVLHLGGLTPGQVADALAADALSMSDVSAFGIYTNDDARTDVTLSALTQLGQPAHLDTQTAQDSGSWLVGLARGTTPGVGMAVIGFLDPQDDEPSDAVSLGGACGVLDADADLHRLTPVPAPLDGPWTVDWSEVTTDARGLPFVSSDVDSVMLARYAGATLDDLEAAFLDLELRNDGMWTLPVENATATALDGLADADGGAFPGFDTDATWILALRCGLCANPAPLVLTVVTPA